MGRDESAGTRMETVASMEFIWIGRDERETLISARVGRPHPQPGARAESEWRCPVAIDGLGESYVDICGAGGLQTLALGLDFLYMRLANLTANGGRLLLPHSRRECNPALLRSTFGRDR